MLAIPFLIPPSYIPQAYLATHVKRPVETAKVKFSRTGEFSSFISNLGIREDTFVIKNDTVNFCEAMGTSFFIQGKAIISINPRFYALDQEACLWAMKCKAFHIKNNDYFYRPSVSAISSLAAAIISTFFLPTISGVVVTMIAATVSYLLLSRHFEGNADDFAIANSSNGELKAARRFVKATLTYNLEKRGESKLLTFPISSAGDNRMIFASPSLTSRLKKIEAALQNRSIGLDDDEELHKINELKIFINNSKGGKI